MADSYSKKENIKKKEKKREEKRLQREDRKTNNNKGKSLEDMIAYVDINGNLTDVPPHLQNREEDHLTVTTQCITVSDSRQKHLDTEREGAPLPV